MSAAAGALVADWPAPARIRTAVTTRQMAGASLTPFDAFNLGTQCGDDGGAVSANRAALTRVLDLPKPPCWLRQVHATTAVRFAASTPLDEAPAADASITADAGVVLAILTADCLPLLVCSDDGAEIAAIHAGWRGLAAGVIDSTLAAVTAPRESLLVWLGPAIGAASYEVGAEVFEAFVAADAGHAAAFRATRPGHWHCDLYALARRRLVALGVTRVYGGGFDTFADARFYSYRRAARTGRFASLIWIDAHG